MIDQAEEHIVVNLHDRSSEEDYHECIRTLTHATERSLEDERARVSGYLHDELGQSLTATLLRLAWLRKKLASANPEVQEELNVACEETNRMTDAVRDLAHNLRPPILDHEGLVAAIRSHASTFSSHSNIACRVIAQPAEVHAVDPVATVAYRIVQEALTNVGRHSGATYCEVYLMAFPEFLEITIRDNGRGVESDADLGTGGSLGIMGMRERAASVGGAFEIRNRETGGLIVKARLPNRLSSGRTAT
jgi:signal transduction histidine kinase